MYLYVWDAAAASGSGTVWLGVAGSQDEATAAAAACLAPGGTARVEEAWFEPGSITRPGYQRTGICWTGRVHGDRVVWAASKARTAA